MLASKIDGKPFDQAVRIWREEITKSSINAATQISQSLLKEKTMKQRIEANPNDADAKAYFEKKKNKQLVDEQYHQTVQEYPERYDEGRLSYLIPSTSTCLILFFPLQSIHFFLMEFTVWVVF